MLVIRNLKEQLKLLLVLLEKKLVGLKQLLDKQMLIDI
jgi:hypothetical protein